MTVKELMKKLEDFDPDMEVAFAYNYGDYWNTIVLNRARHVIQEQAQYSEYHYQYALSREGTLPKTFVILT